MVSCLIYNGRYFIVGSLQTPDGQTGDYALLADIPSHGLLRGQVGAIHERVVLSMA